MRKAMHPNQQSIDTFYSAFARQDPDTMAQCYAQDASFDDEVFSLRGKREVAGMWRMLCQATQAKGADVWKLTYRDVRADADSGQAHWDAHYRFSSTGKVGRPVKGPFRASPGGRSVGCRGGLGAWLVLVVKALPGRPA
jgi:ketosteroid isomerase-like protein